jgi:hypothetical protein
MLYISKQIVKNLLSGGFIDANNYRVMGIKNLIV